MQDIEYSLARKLLHSPWCARYRLNIVLLGNYYIVRGVQDIDLIVLLGNYYIVRGVQDIDLI